MARTATMAGANAEGKIAASPATVEAPPTDSTASDARKLKLGKAGKRLGIAAFCFFLIKGLLWLAVPAYLARTAWLE